MSVGVSASQATSGSCSDQFKDADSGGDWEVASNWASGLPGPNTVVCWDIGQRALFAGFGAVSCHGTLAA